MRTTDWPPRPGRAVGSGVGAPILGAGQLQVSGAAALSPVAAMARTDAALKASGRTRDGWSEMPDATTLFLRGDIMPGRGVDQVLPEPESLRLRSLRQARRGLRRARRVGAQPGSGADGFHPRSGPMPPSDVLKDSHFQRIHVPLPRA